MYQQSKGYIENWKDCHSKKCTKTFVNDYAKNAYVRLYQLITFKFIQIIII